MPADEVLARIAEHARGTMADFLRIDDEEITLTWSLLSVPATEDGEPDIAGAIVSLASQENVKPTDRILHTATIKRPAARLDLQEAGRRGKLGLIKKYSLDDKGKVSIELYDAQAALTLLAKHHGLLSADDDDWRKALAQMGYNASELFGQLVERFAQTSTEGA